MGAAQAPLPEGRFGPTIRGGRVRTGGPDWLRLSVIALVVIAVPTLALGVSTAGVILYGTQTIDRVEVPNLVEQADTDGDGVVDEDPEVAEITQVLNILVVGTDDRTGLTDQQLLELGTDRDAGGLTDTIMLVQLDPLSDRASLLSFPRDLLVERCDGTDGKINSAHAIGEMEGMPGGPACVVETVTNLTSIPIHHYVEVDLEGFIEVVDAIGGVTLYLDEPITDVPAGVDLDAGCVTMDGRTALGFVRIRSADNDYGRIARQQRFLREILSQAAELGTLVNVPRMFSLIDAAARAVHTDPGLDLGKMQRIAFSLREIGGSEGLATRTVPGDTQRIDGLVYEVIDEELGEELFTAFREGELPPNEVVAAEPEAVGLDDLPELVVLNGAGVQGLASDARQDFEEAGFTVSETGNADSFGVGDTVVTYSPERQREAELLADALGVDAERGEPGQDLTVLLGRDYVPRMVLAADIRNAGDVQETEDDSDPRGGEPEEPGEPDPTAIEQFVGATPINVDCT